MHVIVQGLMLNYIWVTQATLILYKVYSLWYLLDVGCNVVDLHAILVSYHHVISGSCVSSKYHPILWREETQTIIILCAELNLETPTSQ